MTARKRMSILGSTTMLASAAALGQAYTHQTTATVGYVQVTGERAGVTVWRQKNDVVFPGCNTDPTQMWINLTGVTEESGKSMLAVLLAARAMDQTVTVYYSIHPSGYCQMGHVAVN